jgi:hypothetical protein
MIDWKTKLTSRKFWAAIAQFVTMLIIAFGGEQETATEVTALIMAGAAVVAYIIGEGLIDAANAGNAWVLEEGQGEVKPPDEAKNEG